MRVLFAIVGYISLVSTLVLQVDAQQCSEVIKEHWVDLGNFTREDITLRCPDGFIVNMQYVKLVQAYRSHPSNEIIQECVIEPIYQYHSLCLDKSVCELVNPEYYNDILKCDTTGQGTNFLRMEYFCDALPRSSEKMSICEERVWTGSQLYLYSSPPGTPAITQTDCKCVITLAEQSAMAAYVGEFSKESSIDGFDLTYNPCQQKVQMTTFQAHEIPYVQRSFCSRFAGVAREECSNRMKIIYIEVKSVTPWVSMNFSFSFTSPTDKPMKVECGITDVLGRPTNPPLTTTTTTTTAAPTTTTKPPTTTTTATTTSAPTTDSVTTVPTTKVPEPTTTEAKQTTPSKPPKPPVMPPSKDPNELPGSTNTSRPETKIAGGETQEKTSSGIPLELIIGITAGVMGAFVLVGMIAAAVCATRRKSADNKPPGAADAQLSGDGSVYHVYEYVEPGMRYSGPYDQPDMAPPGTGVNGGVPTVPRYPTYPRTVHTDTLSSNPGYLDPPPDYPMDSLQNQRNESIQQHSVFAANQRWNTHDTRTTASQKHTRFQTDPHMGGEDDVAHNPLYGKSHDLFFAY